MTQPARDLRVLWDDICGDGRYRGCWVALRDASFAEGRPVEGVLVDYDMDLGALCGRIRSGAEHGCTIAYCDDASSGVRRLHR